MLLPHFSVSLSPCSSSPSPSLSIPALCYLFALSPLSSLYPSTPFSLSLLSLLSSLFLISSIDSPFLISLFIFSRPYPPYFSLPFPSILPSLLSNPPLVSLCLSLLCFPRSILSLLYIHLYPLIFLLSLSYLYYSSIFPLSSLSLSFYVGSHK